MKIITRASLAATAYERWKSQYPKDMVLSGGRSSDAITEKLRLLPRDATPDDVDKAIYGNGCSWTRVPTCDECRNELASAVVEIGAEPDYESSTAYICLGCIERAQKKLEAARWAS